MKIIRWAFFIWAIVATIIILLAMSKSKEFAETHLFCAYNRLFVEFEENGKRWGTLMLDYDGRPIPCRDNDAVKLENTI